jgi:type VI secretion system protein ImpG
MSDTLYRYYERELLYTRQLTRQFSEKYPAVAGRLLLEPNRCADPHVERLIEAFALLTARIEQKLDDEFPELTDALLNVLYPHYLAPVPSMTMVQFDADPENPQPQAVTVPRHSRMHTQKIDGVACEFRTCYPVELWPVGLSGASITPLPLPFETQAPRDTAAALVLDFQCHGGLKLSDLPMDRLRFYLHGARELIADLYELIFNRALGVELRSTDRNAEQASVFLTPDEALSEVGFGRDEGLLPYRNQSFLGYRLLTELFAFPQKFHFLDIRGWQAAAQAGFGQQFRAIIYLSRTSPTLERQITADAFRLGCSPAANLFEQTAEPIQLSHTRHEYRVVPDVHHQHGYEVYSVDSVTSADPRSTTQYRPFYSFQHANAWNPAEDDGAYWYASRRPTVAASDQGTDVWLHLVDLTFDPHEPADAVAVVHTTATNRDLPDRLHRAGRAIQFELETAAPLARIRCLHPPTAPLRPPLRRGAHWRLISHLSLNHLSLSDPVEGRQTLQEILRLYDFSDPEESPQNAAVNRQMIEGILDLSSRRVVGRTAGATSGGFCRGIEIALELDEHQYTGTGVYLFSSVLERYFAMYASLNSFSQLVVRLKGSDAPLKRWPPRAGEEPLL